MKSREELNKYTGKKIGILGIGLEGLASAYFLKEQGGIVTLLDQAESLDQETTTNAKKLGEVVLGKNAFSNLSNFDLVVRSPGVKRSTPGLVAASEKGVKVTSQTQIFLEECPCLVVGVTGTKGKGTTSTLIAKMLESAGFKTYLGGNIGTPPLTFLHLLDESSRVVLELSSFQLQDVTISPDIAVMLMVTSEHLDYHATVEEYIDAKRNILRFQKAEDFAVINRDYLASHESDIFTDGKVFQISIERPSTEEGCYLKEDALWMSMQGSEWKVIDREKIALLGHHNLENVAAASMAATLAGASKEDIYNVLTSFKGLEHRIEFVKEVKGVVYYNDSFSTTPETAIAAIKSFLSPEILILGGSSKNSDFTQLGKALVEAKNIKAIIGIGQEWERIKEATHGLPEHVLLLEGAKDMHTIVQVAATIAKSGDVVLLSPACASFDMFKNYKERGNQFKKEVQAL